MVQGLMLRRGCINWQTAAGGNGVTPLAAAGDQCHRSVPLRLNLQSTSPAWPVSVLCLSLLCTRGSFRFHSGSPQGCGWAESETKETSLGRVGLPWRGQGRADPGLVICLCAGEGWLVPLTGACGQPRERWGAAEPPTSLRWTFEAPGKVQSREGKQVVPGGLASPVGRLAPMPSSGLKSELESCKKS